MNCIATSCQSSVCIFSFVFTLKKLCTIHLLYSACFFRKTYSCFLVMEKWLTSSSLMTRFGRVDVLRRMMVWHFLGNHNKGEYLAGAKPHQTAIIQSWAWTKLNLRISISKCFLFTLDSASSALVVLHFHTFVYPTALSRLWSVCNMRDEFPRYGFLNMMQWY